MIKEKETDETARGCLAMSSLVLKVKHPYVTQKKGVCGGKPVIAGTRIPVWAVAGWRHRGYSPERMQRDIYPSLGLAEIYDALSYYHDHKEDIDRQLEENSLSPSEARRRQVKWRQLHSS